MSKYTLLGADGEISGFIIQACVESSQGEYLKPFLASHDLLHPDPNKWYPLSRWLGFLNDVYDAGAGAASASYVAIGLREIEKVPFAAHIKTLPQALEAIEEAYHQGYRGQEIGEILVEKVKERHYRVLFAIPLPDDYLYGVLYGLARRFLAHGNAFVVSYDPEILPRDEGGAVTSIEVVW